MGASNSSEIKKAGIPPEKAFILFTEEGWGCIYNQQIKKDVTNLIALEDGEFVRVEEIKNPEDRDNRYELYLYFLAKESSGLPGYYILRLEVKHQNPLAIGYLLVDQARLKKGDKGYFVELKAKADGLIVADLLYSRQPRLTAGLFSCPEADLFDPYKVNFLKAYEISSGLRIVSEMMNKKWDRINIAIDPFLLKEVNLVDASEKFLDALDKEFSSSKDFIFLWDKSKVSTKSIENIALRIEQEKRLKYNISINIRYKEKTETISRGEKLFVPDLRQKISIKEPNGKLTGGEVWIGIRS